MNFTMHQPLSQCVSLRVKGDMLIELKKEGEKTDLSLSRIINKKVCDSLNILFSESKRK